MQRSESSMQSYQFTYKPFVLMAQIELSKLSCSTALILLCSSEHQSKLSQKQSGFSGSSFSTQCGHTWSYQGLDCPKLLYVICKYSLFWCFFFSMFPLLERQYVKLHGFLHSHRENFASAKMCHLSKRLSVPQMHRIC